MRKIILLEHLSLDGFASGPNGEMDFLTYDSELESYVHQLHATTDAAIYGHNTYNMMQGYWPTVLNTPDAGAGEMNHARWYDAATKVVVSRSMKATDSKTVVVGTGNLADEVNALKQHPGKDLWLIGSIASTRAFLKLGLVDEYWLNINPVVLGKGESIFEGVGDLKLKLIGAKPFACGVVAFRYENA